jgi:Carbohydrate esterase, sialic acid-specific acetylesterase
LSKPGRGGSGYAARIYGQVSYSDDSLLHASFSADGSPADMSHYAGLRFYYRGTGYFHYRSLQPSIYDYDDYISRPWQASKDWQDTTIWFKDLHQAGWGIPEPLTPASLSGFDLEVLQAPTDVALAPSSLFNGMIAPLIPFAIRGAVWYQGESNAPRAYQYRTLLPALIRGWRQAWGEGDFPFLIVQLPNFGQRPEQPGEDVWAELREAQLMALRLPNTGLAVTIDLGSAVNLHPPRKAEVGHRLALWALGTTYHKDIVYSGPLYNSKQIEGNQIKIHFTHLGGGLEAHGPSLRGFAIAGADRVFHWANASIEGDAVVISSPAVPSPVAVRYAWAGNPDCNLYNKAGLPASPFRTDDWPGSTVKAK